MRDLNFAIKNICRNNRDGSFSTQSNRSKNLDLIARELRELGYKDLHSPNQFKSKHVYALLNKWNNIDKPIAVGTIKNRMAALRWVGEKCGNRGFIKSTNDSYGISRRSFIGEDKSLEFTNKQLAEISDPRIRLSAELQKHFGLRREEAIKFTVSYADRGTHIHLKSSWCKGGRERDIPIVTPEQAQLLKDIRAVVGNASLIPSDLKYIQQQKLFEKELYRVGLGKSHGARHNYAQQRYTQLSHEIRSRLSNQDLPGFAPVCAGGLRPSQMSEQDRQIDREARQRLSFELGHDRIQICANYLGG